MRRAGRGAALFLLLGSFLVVSGLVVDRPCCSNMLHVPAAFGPDLLTLDAPIKAQQLVVVDPEDACEELRNTDLKGKVALIKRGNCNFTEKIFRVQQHEAVAAVVYDSQDRDRWGTIMSGVEDEVGRVVIPSVFVSHSTGLTLKNASQQAGGQEGEEVGVVLVTLNDTGHVKPKTKRIGPIETLATYVVVSLVLLSFSGCCGLLLALCVTCYQRAFRVRALRNLKTQTFKRPPNAAKRRSATESTISSESSISTSGSISSEASPSRAASVEVPSLSLRRSVLSRLFGRSSTLSEARPIAAGSPPSPRGGAASEATSSSPQKLKDAAAEGVGTPATSINTSASSWDDDNRSLCAICLDDYEDGDTLRLLPCGHSFHDICIKPWLMEKSEACPMCKRPAFRRSGSGYRASDGPVDERADFRVALPLDTAALDDVGAFLRTNASFFAMVLMAVITSATVLGAMAIVRPAAPPSPPGGT